MRRTGLSGKQGKKRRVLVFVLSSPATTPHLSTKLSAMRYDQYRQLNLAVANRETGSGRRLLGF